MATGAMVSLKPETTPLVVVFLSARCPCTASHLPALSELYREYSTKGVRFVGVHSNIDEPAEDVKLYFAHAGLPFPVIQDPEQRLADEFGALKTPHAFIVSPSGKVLFRGGVDSSAVTEKAEKHFLRDALSAVVAGKTPEITEARALGCVIRRK